MKDKNIFIQNIYYMLTYAFKVLKQTNYENVASEPFDTIEDLFVAILTKGISQQVKQGLYREYVSKQDTSPTLRGKLNLQQTIQHKMQRKQLLSYEYDDLSENNRFNQILKATLIHLISCDVVTNKYKQDLKRVIKYFETVDLKSLEEIQWNSIFYNRDNATYEMLINICYFVSERLLQTTRRGTYKVTGFTEQHMEKLYERFVLEYYKKHYSDSLHVSAEQVSWNLDMLPEMESAKLLPIMQTDITLKDKKTSKILIIDTKYYTNTLQSYYNTQTIHSNNLYQIFTYVKNKDKERNGTVAGLLLYAKTDEDITPDATFSMSGNQISVKTLDLNCSFEEIKKQLDDIVKIYFAINKSDSI